MNVKSSTLPLKKKLFPFPFPFSFSFSFPPCKRMLHLFFNLRYRKPLFIRRLRFRFRLPRIKLKREPKRKGFTKFLSIFKCFRQSSTNKDMDRITEFKSLSADAEYFNKAPHPSPLTPAYVRMSAAPKIRREVAAAQQEVEDACRSFENYLMEMILEEGKTRDLMDVEELLHCWKNLKSPVFIDLVCRFYAELCRDLFSDNN